MKVVARILLVAFASFAAGFAYSDYRHSQEPVVPATVGFLHALTDGDGYILEGIPYPECPATYDLHTSIPERDEVNKLTVFCIPRK